MLERYQHYWISNRFLCWVLALILLAVGVLFGLIVPGLQAKREEDQQDQCYTNMKKIAFALCDYDLENGRYPEQANYDENGIALLSWRVHILPFVDDKNARSLYRKFHLDEPWDSDHNKKLISRMPSFYSCPGDPHDGKTTYLGASGEGLLMDRKNKEHPFIIRDGTSRTIGVVEVQHEYAVTWTQPIDLEFDLNNPRAKIGSRHQGIFFVGKCDGSATDMPVDFDTKIFVSRLTIAGREYFADDGELIIGE